MRPAHRYVGRTVAIFFLIMLSGGALELSAAHATARSGSEWSSSNGSWRGTGSVLVPGGGFVGAKQTDATPSDCPDCRWEVPDCAAAAANCGVNGGCLKASTVEVWFSPNANMPMTLSHVACVEPGRTVMSLAQMGSLVRERIKAVAPKLNVSFQPPGGAITQLPTVFATGQPTLIERDDTIAGYSVHFKATPRWTWSWGDGEVSTTTKPGGAWPDVSVSHTYRNEGTVKVVVECAWSAQFWVDGSGPYRVFGGAVTQSETQELTVRQARAALVPERFR